MKETMQHCKECHRAFYPDKGGYFDKSDKQYICTSCGKTIPIGGTVVPLFRRQSTKALIIKLVCAVVCFAACFYAEPGEVGACAILIAAGLALIVYALLPIVKERKYLAEFQQMKADEKVLEDSTPWNCTHCGASTTGKVCSYCGSAKE